MPKLIGKRYYISIAEKNPRQFREITNGKPVVIVDYLDTFIYWNEKGKLWTVSELRTGAFISISSTTQKKAIEKAKEILEFVGKEKTLAQIEKLVALSGEAPKIT